MLANPTDGHWLICVRPPRLGGAVNRKRVLRERKLIQRRLTLDRRKPPVFSRVEWT